MARKPLVDSVNALRQRDLTIAGATAWRVFDRTACRLRRARHLNNASPDKVGLIANDGIQQSLNFGGVVFIVSGHNHGNVEVVIARVMECFLKA